jgi:hypothetical protein
MTLLIIGLFFYCCCAAGVGLKRKEELQQEIQEIRQQAKNY